MSITIHNSQFHQMLSDPLEIEGLLAELLKKEEITFFISRSTNEELHVTCTKKGSVVIYLNYNDPYVALDASKTPTWARKKVKVHIGGQQTTFYENIVITKQEVQTIAEKYCVNGELSSAVYWLKEGTEPR